ncbi:hypothetical protein K1719_029311 [Acacia pycnantha]|nr:hypothetical protein K1719_029311 [Acacia pycnantha]
MEVGKMLSFEALSNQCSIKIKQRLLSLSNVGSRFTRFTPMCCGNIAQDFSERGRHLCHSVGSFGTSLSSNFRCAHHKSVYPRLKPRNSQFSLRH